MKLPENSKLLFSQNEIDAGIDFLAGEMWHYFRDQNPLFLIVMNGALPFSMNLLSKLDFELEYDCICYSRYSNDSENKFLYQPKTSLKGRVVILLDDINDEGVTLEFLKNWCKMSDAEDVFTATLFNKLVDKKGIQSNFNCFDVKEDEFIFGFGLDLDGKCRNLNGVYCQC